MKYTIIIVVLFLLLSCKNKDEEIGRPDSYILTEKDISQDCSAFQMRFKKGEYILNFALSGTCENLKVEEYTHEYSRYLNHYHDSLSIRKGYIMLKYYKHNFLDTNIKDLQDSILKITRKSFKDKVLLSEADENSFIIKVGT
ncbi:hypothetical protein [Flavobacterium bizetiae]|uniref:hypothetical protein n=1 Tax=Flavobacterium bizetiae TaxID=2704140 RepID=UPI003756B3AB